MKVLAKSLSGLCLAVAALASIPAQALTISFGGVNASTGGPTNLTSSLVGAANQPLPASGIFVETFDRPAGAGGGCGWNSPVNSGAGSIGVTGPMGIHNDNVSGVRAAPSGDTSCYGTDPDTTAGLGQ